MIVVTGGAGFIGSAIVWKLNKLGNDKIIIVAHHGKAHFTKVKTGIRQAANIELTNGIQSGDTIITSGLQFLKDGDKLIYSSIK